MMIYICILVWMFTLFVPLSYFSGSASWSVCLIMKFCFCFEHLYMVWVMKDDEGIFASLDRYVHSESWSNLFPTYCIKTLCFYCSDHHPIFIQFGQPKSLCKKVEVCHFHYEHKWLSDKYFKKDFRSEMNLFLGHSNLSEMLTSC